MQPADSIVNLSSPVNLSWLPATNAALYDVYLWKDGDPVPTTPYLPDVASINVKTRKLENFARYNWKVVSKNSCFSVEGPVQSFSTIGDPDLVVKSLTTTEELMGGDKITISWEVKNEGDGTTGNRRWKDYI